MKKFWYVEPLLIVVLALGIWLIMSGLQGLIAPASSSLGGAWIWAFILGLLLFFGSIVAEVVVMDQRQRAL